MIVFWLASGHTCVLDQRLVRQSRMITAEKTLKREKKQATRLQQKELAADLREQRRQARPAGVGVLPSRA